MKTRVSAVVVLATATLALAHAAYASGASDSSQASANQIRAQMKTLRQEMNRKMNALQQQLNNLKNKNTQQTKQLATNQKATKNNKSALADIKQTKLGGFFQIGYLDQLSQNTSSGHGGDLSFTNLVLQIDGNVGKFIYGAGYRFYSSYRLLHYGWGGYKFSDTDKVEAGLFQVPFGNLPYGYFSYYGGIPYYLGYNDNQNVGVEWAHSGRWDFNIAFFKNSQLGTSSDHYGSNPTPGADAFGQNQDNLAINQGDVRVGYTFGNDTDYSTNIAVSGKGGQFYNNTTNDSGSDWAAAASLNGKYGNWHTLLQATAYKYNPDNPTGVSDDLVQIGSFDFTYLIPAKAQIYQASLAYTIPLNWGLLKSVTISDDYAYQHIGSGIDYDLTPQAQNLEDPQSNDFGAYWLAPPFFMWTDIVSGKNFLGYIGKADDDWHSAVVARFGLTF